MPEDSASTRSAEARRLAAIMFTDIVGFSRQMGANEARTLRLLEIHNQTIRQAVTEHHRHVIKIMWDAFLVDFPSVVHAVQCAQRVQAHFHTYNTDKDRPEQIHVRIGIHLGDIVQRDGDVFGDGVNIASRLQALAEPDTICLSQVVYKEVEKKLSLGTVLSWGRPPLKGIAERFPVYALLPEPPTGLRQTLHIQRVKLKHQKRVWQVVAAVLAMGAISFGTLVLKNLYFPSAPQSLPQGNTSAIASSLPLPDKPSLVVLPFINMSGDPEQEYFSDGITEDLTTDLSKLSSLFVISRNSAFTYKGKAVKVQAVSKELGVRYVLEGSVRKTEKQVRISVQLVDARSDHHLWAERYDRPLTDIFAVQDEMVQKIVTTLQLQVTLAEQGVLTHKGTNTLEAYDAYLRGLESYLRRTQEANAQARQLCERAIALDPRYAEAHALQGRTYLREWLWGWNQDPQTLEQALVFARQAIALDGSLPMAHRLLAYVYLWQKQYDRAITEAEQALALDPNDAEGYETLGEILSFAGRPQDTLGLAEKGLRLNPRQPVSLLWLMGHAYLLTGRYDEAIATFKKALSSNPNHFASHIHLAVIYSALGREEEARAEGAEALRLNPHFSLEVYQQYVPYKDPAAFERWLSGLRKAGLK